MKELAGKRILMLLENYTYPADGRVRHEAISLTRAGHQVTVIAPARKGEPASEVVDGVRVLRFRDPGGGDGVMGYLWEYGWSLVMTFFLTLYVFVRYGFDVIHAHSPPDLFVLIAAPYKLLGKRFIFDHHDLSPEMYEAKSDGGGNRLLYRGLVFFEQLTCRLADHVIATNDSYKKVEMQRGGVPEERITVVRNGPDFSRVRRVEPDQELRAKAGTIIGYVGVMGHQDGIDHLLRALHRLIHDLQRTDFFCVLIGKGDARESLIALAADLGLNDHVWFTGFVSDEDMLRYLSTADIFVDPDPANPFNDRSTMIKMMEYMALARPIVAFDLTEHRVTAQDAALYATGNDELDFAAKIAHLMDHPAEGERMGRRGRERVETHLCWRMQEKSLFEAYSALGIEPVQQSDRPVTVSPSEPTDAVDMPATIDEQNDLQVVGHSRETITGNE